MNETHTTVRGTVITDPTTRRVGDDQVFTFRVASNSRYQDRLTGEWKTGGTLYFSANCWGRLGQRASGALCKGDGVILHGRLRGMWLIGHRPSFRKRRRCGLDRGRAAAFARPRTKMVPR